MSALEESFGLGGPLLRTDVVRLHGQIVLVLAGEIDLSTASAVRDAAETCLRWHPGRLSVDLSAVQFCDATGMHALQWAAEQAEAQAVGFALRFASPAVRRVFVLAGSEDMLEAHEVVAANL